MYLALSDLFLAKAEMMVMNPTLPRNIINMRMIFPAKDTDGVTPIVRPTVA